MSYLDTCTEKPTQRQKQVRKHNEKKNKEKMNTVLPVMTSPSGHTWDTLILAPETSTVMNEFVENCTSKTSTATVLRYLDTCTWNQHSHGNERATLILAPPSPSHTHIHKHTRKHQCSDSYEWERYLHMKLIKFPDLKKKLSCVG